MYGTWYAYTTVTFRIYAYSNLANCKFTLMQYTVLQIMSECQASKKLQRNQLQQGNSASATARKIEDS